jgi:hypothetical protein
MNVPPFVPQPIEIPGNVTEETYLVRLAFIRRVVAMFALSLAVVLLASLNPLYSGPYDLVFIFVYLLMLSTARGLAKGRAVEQRISLIVSLALFLSLGFRVHRLLAGGWPIWCMGVGTLCLVLYTFCCGRDLSFMGMWFFSLLATSTLVLILGNLLKDQPVQILEAVLLSAAYVSYWVYDLAALLTRRRLGEEFGAVLDLYRDVLNMFSYPIRVWTHWRTHKIWSARS